MSGWTDAEKQALLNSGAMTRADLLALAARIEAALVQCPDCGMTVDGPCSHPGCRYRTAAVLRAMVEEARA